MRLVPLLLLAVVTSAALVACDGSDDGNGNDDGAATPTETPTAAVTDTAEPAETPTTSATAAPTGTPSGSPTASATPTEPMVTPTAGGEARRTGIDGVDAVIEAIVTEDAATLERVFVTRTMECTTAQGLGAPPPCMEGEPEGTEVEVFPYGSCEVEYSRDIPASVQRFLQEVEGEPYAVAESPEDDVEGLSYGEYMVVFEMADPALDGGMAAFVEDGQVVHVASLCLASPDDFLDWRGEQELEVILPPPSTEASQEPIY